MNVDHAHLFYCVAHLACSLLSQVVTKAVGFVPTDCLSDVASLEQNILPGSLDECLHETHCGCGGVYFSGLLPRELHVELSASLMQYMIGEPRRR
jgi:hypothetical protein